MPPKLVDSPSSGSRAAELTTPDPRISRITAWVGQFSRTLKTCRLYDSRNPTALKFRTDLAAQMTAMLETDGAFELEFAARDVLCDGQSVLNPATRDENFERPFHRDGVRTLHFNAGAGQAELDVIVDLVLRVTSRSAGTGDDLVTLLWDADLPHVDMAYIASETDADLDSLGLAAGPGSGLAPRSGKLMPWPDRGTGGTGAGEGDGARGTGGEGHGGENGDGGDGAACDTGPAPGLGEAARGSAAAEATQASAPETDGAASGAAAADTAANPVADSRVRSDDWLAGEPAGELDERFAVLEAASETEVARLVAAMRAERATPAVTSTLALAGELLRADLQEEDRPEVAALLGRALQDSIAAANWREARQAVLSLGLCTDGWWDLAALIADMANPESATTAELVHHLDAAAVPELQEFSAFARNFGPAAIEWLMAIVSLAAHQRTRRTLAHALCEMCEGKTERLAPWLSDPRWYVVRNAVVILGDIEGGVPAGPFRPLVRHPEARVRQALVEALKNVNANEALPLLLDMVHDAEPSVRGAVLHRLGSERNPRVSAALLAILVEPAFRKRPADDVRAFTAALGGSADESALPQLEEQLYPPGWFTKGAGPHCQAIARCIARIGTTSAIERLERGARSRIPAARDACRLVLKGLGHA